MMVYLSGVRTRLLIVFLLTLLLAGCGGDSSSSSADTQTWPPRFDEPRPGQVSPAEVHWLQGRDYWGSGKDAYSDTRDAGSVDEYLLALESGVYANCLFFYSGPQCAFVEEIPEGARARTGLSADIASFDNPRQGQQAPVQVFWLQGRDFSESYTNTYDRGSISEYLFELKSGLRADCLSFYETEQCVYVNTDGRIVGSSSATPPPAEDE
jgi:hypothetical protein